MVMLQFFDRLLFIGIRKLLNRSFSPEFQTTNTTFVFAIDAQRDAAGQASRAVLIQPMEHNGAIVSKRITL